MRIVVYMYIISQSNGHMRLMCILDLFVKRNCSGTFWTSTIGGSIKAANGERMWVIMKRNRRTARKPDDF